MQYLQNFSIELFYCTLTFEKSIELKCIDNTLQSNPLTTQYCQKGLHECIYVVITHKFHI